MRMMNRLLLAERLAFAMFLQASFSGSGNIFCSPAPGKTQALKRKPASSTEKEPGIARGAKHGLDGGPPFTSVTTFIGSSTP